MGNYHMEISTISRGKGHSFSRRVNYVTGERIHDDYQARTYYDRRQDVLDHRIFQPEDAPAEFYDLQTLCNAVEQVEKRWDARTGREFKGSLPNELPLHDLIQIVNEYVDTNFVRYGLCAIAALHEGSPMLRPIHTAAPIWPRSSSI